MLVTDINASIELDDTDAFMKSQKKILVVCQHFWPETFRINDVCDFLIEKKCNIDVLCGIPNYPKGEFFEDYGVFKNRRQVHNGVNIRRVFEIKRGNNKNFRIFLNYISFPIASIFHIPRLLTRKYDKIFIYQLSPVMMSIAGIIIGKIKKTETTMYVLDLWPENLFSVLDIKNPFLRKLTTKISHWHYRKVDKLVVLSETMKKHLEKVVNLPADKIIVLPQVCEKVYEKDVFDKAIHTKYNKGFNILYTGNISPAQSFQTMIQAAKSLVDEGFKDINWIIIGDGMSRNWVESEVKKNNLSEYFYFEGTKPIEDIPKYSPVADALIGCLVKSDLLEATIPAKVMSYIAGGRPILLAMDGEVRDLIENKIKCGFVSTTEDPEELVKNIKKLYHMTPGERDKMGKLARDYHFKYFERNTSLQKLHDFMFS